MERYEKPSVVINDEMTEGVYAASGAVDDPGSVHVSAIDVVSKGSQYNKVNVYKIKITNSTNEEATDWSVTIDAAGDLECAGVTGATIYNGWLASTTLNNGIIKITPGGGGAIAAGESIEVELVVNYN